jgi:hypothetical protein
LDPQKIQILIQLLRKRVKVIEQHAEAVHFHPKVAVGLLTGLNEDFNTVIFVNGIVSIFVNGCDVTVLTLIADVQRVTVSQELHDGLLFLAGLIVPRKD